MTGKTNEAKFVADKEALRSLLESIDAQVGIIYDATATAQTVRAMMRAQGVRAQDNDGSRELMRMRYGDDCDSAAALRQHLSTLLSGRGR